MDGLLLLGIALSAVGLLLLGGSLLARQRQAATRARANSQLPPLVTIPARQADGATAPRADGDGNGDMEMVDGRSVRFYRPLDGTLRMLPGRLEIVEGEDQGRDIRFVETSEGIPEITFGRSTGPPHRHVQLLSRTVSRQHAIIEYDAGRWKITNLSRTNPVVVNHAELNPPEDQRLLSDGDRIEMGEVVFVFRER